jgi:hypothetical protein
VNPVMVPPPSVVVVVVVLSETCPQAKGAKADTAKLSNSFFVPIPFLLLFVLFGGRSSHTSRRLRDAL